MLRKIPASVRTERLLAIWALKEAIAKATGLGFHFPLACITIQWEGRGQPMVEFEPEVADDASLWRLALLRLVPYHMAAVAVRGTLATDIAVRFEKGSPLIP